MIQANCPKGHRLLLQLPKATDETQARADLVFTFGPRKGLAAKLVRGHWTQPRTVRDGKSDRIIREVSEFVPWGFRAYLPVDD